MKRNVFWLGMLAMVLTFGMTAVGCDDGSGNTETDGNTETITGTYQLEGNTITFSFPGDNMDGLTATFNGNTITIDGITEEGGEFLNGTYTHSGSSSGLSGPFTRTIPGEGIITFTFSGNDKVTVVLQQFDGDYPKGSMTVSNIPQEYVGGSYRLYAEGGDVSGADNSGRVWSGAAQGNTMTTTPITGTTVVLTLNWRSGTTGNETLAVGIYITTDTSVNINSSGVPDNIIQSKDLTLTFSGRNASVNWSGGGGTDPFAGTWEMVGDVTGVKIVAANGSFETSMDGKVLYKGTYTYEGNNVTSTITHVNPWSFGQGDDHLYTWADLPQKYKDNPDYNFSQINQMTVTGNTISANGMTFTKQGSGNSGGSLSGTYSMSGNFQDGTSYTISITFSGNAFTFTMVVGGETEPPFSGTYSLNGNTITFSDPDDGGAFPETATLSGDRNSFVISGEEGGGAFLNGTYTR